MKRTFCSFVGLIAALWTTCGLLGSRPALGDPADGLTDVLMVKAGTLEPNDRVAILGDSITEQKNYSAIIEDYLLACQPAAGLQAAQFGWGGETTWGLAPRLQQDVLWFKPTVATINYGMNDGGYAKVDEKRLADYRENTKRIIDQLKASGTRLIIVGGPGAVDVDAFSRGHELALIYNQTLATFGKAAREVAQQENVSFADLHTVMADAMVKFKQLHPGKSFAGPDGIHPDNVGHTVMAYAFLKAMGCDGDIGTITIDLSADKADATAGHRIISMTQGEAVVESSRYPFEVNKTLDPLSIFAAMDVVPFQQDLNRFRLVVTNIPAGKKVKVTWSEVVPEGSDQGGAAGGVKPIVVTEEFSAEELAAGINLASAFATTPFDHAFGRLDATVHAQQDFETPLNKHWLHDEPTLSRDVPSAATAIQDLATTGEQFDEQLRKLSSAVVVPVRHKIKLEIEP